jgi:TolA-binding protein
MMRREGIVRSFALMALAGAFGSTASAADAPAPVNAEELRAFRDTLERYSSRMREFEKSVADIVDRREADEQQRVESVYSGMVQRLQSEENAQRVSAVQRLEAFLRKYPVSPHSADMKFRLADLYFESAELEFDAARVEYARLTAAAEGRPDVVVPESPRKDYSRAIALYRDIVTNNTDYDSLADSYYMLAWCYNAPNSEQYDADAARVVNEQMVSRFPGTRFANDANMMLGEYWFDIPGPRTNPVVNVPTAISYYQAVLADGPEGRNYDEAIYKLGWSNYKLNNYDQALAYMVQLLDYSDKQMLQTGKPSNMRPEAIKYLAISYADIAFNQGKRPIDVAVTHLNRVGDRPWQHEEVEMLAEQLERQGKLEEAVDVWGYLQTHWALDPKNPVYQAKVAEAWLRLSGNDQSRYQAAMKELSERYSDGSAWYVANRMNPEAIAQARSYIETSLAQVATEYYALAQESQNVEDFARAADKFREFLEEYPFGANYNDYEWYYASALYDSNQFDASLLAYDQVVKNDKSPYRDGARYQTLQARRQIVLSRYGKLEDVPAGQTLERTATTDFGKQVLVYAISDEQKAFILSCDDVLDREFTDPDIAKQLDDARAAYSYIPAQILYNHGRYEEARARLERVIDRFPKTKEAGLAAQVLVNSYVNEGDLERVATLVDELKSKKLGADGGDGLGSLATIQEQAVFSLAGAKATRNDHLGASAAYLSFLQRFPQSQYLNVALYNAANQADLAGNAVDAIKLFEQYVAKYPADERSKDLYFRIADTYSATLELDKAIGYYEGLVSRFPDHKDASSAMYNAAFLRVGIGDHRGAATTYERYALTFPTIGDAEATFWRAGEQWELVSENEAVSFYNRYLDRFGAGEPNHAIESLYKLAKLQEKKGDRRAAATWTRLQDAFRAANGASLTARTRSLAAEGAVLDLGKEFAALKAVKWTSSEEKNVELLTKTKVEQVKALTDHAMNTILTYADYDSTAAALYYMGVARFAYADIAYDGPPPKGLSEEELDVYRQVVDEKFRIPSEDEGRKRLQAALDKAKTEKRWSIWNSKTLSALNERFPSDFPSERNESRGAIDPGDVPIAGPTSEVTKKETP